MNKNDFCRTCMRPRDQNLQLRSLDAMLENDGHTDTNTTLLDCLLFCTKLNQDENLPIVICEQCCIALEISYNFIRNALIAQEVWKQKLEKASQMNYELKNPKARAKYRCKLCGKKLISKHELKEHGKTHAGELTYDCTICKLNCSQKQKLQQHYLTVHNIEPTAEQLKPKKIVKPQIKLQHFKELQKTNENSAETTNTEEMSTEDVNVTIGSQYIVLPDGTLQAVEDSNVLIEYIDADANKLNASVVQEEVAQKINSTIEMDSIVVQELGELLVLPQTKELQRKQIQQETETSTTTNESPTKKCLVTCKICTKGFPILSELKEHMLNHRDIPQYFCDQCDFYTFYKKDIRQHYKTKHALEPSPKQLEPRNRAKIEALNQHIYYKCNLCAHKTLYKDNLRRHYVAKHNIPTNHVSLQMHSANEEVVSETKSKVVITSMMTLNGNGTNKPIYEMESKADNNKNTTNLSFDFNGETIFDDLMDGEDSKCNASSLLNSNTVLTSDEEDAKSCKETVANKCNICQKSFSTYYKLENHMFLHRGLAPFHCEMCTNLYHAKSALLRHYLAVHKREPTREMLQPKGDKVNNIASVERITVNKGNIPTLLCGKCPFETKERLALFEHLRLNHNTQNEDFVFSKLLYECPRCIRSFATELDLMQHLQRSHSITTFSYAETNEEPTIISNTTENTAALANGQTNKPTNTMEPEHKCRLCSETYHTFEQLQKHICKLFSHVPKT